MTANDLIAAFERLADAPDGVKRLRELVLQLAVRGKLVAQDPTEKRIAPSTSPPSAGEAPFDLPETWRWLRLPEVADYAVGKTPATKEPRFWGAREIPWVSIGDMPDGGVVTTTTRTVSAAAANEVFRRPPAKAGTLLMSFKLTIGKMAVLGVDAYHNEAIISITPNPRATRDYLLRVLPMMALGGESKDAIMGATLNGQSLARILIPLPPLAEQHRIVARVDELMGLLDRLEAARTARDDVRRAARDAALAALRDAEDTDAVEAAWGRIAGQMDALFAEPEDVGPLRQAVLGLAVRGRLVRQDNRDGTGEAVLRDVEAERSMLAEKGQLRRGSADVDSSASRPSEIPASWRWARAAEVTLLITDGDHQPPPRAEDGLPFVVIGNVSGGWIDLSDTRLVPTAYFESLDWTKKPTRSDLLYTVTGSFGLVIPVADEPPFCVQRHIGIIKTARGMSPTYLMYALRSYYAQKYAADVATGIAQKTVPLSGLRRLPIPVPPLPEQHRIVAKVDALMAICDALEARLTTARDLHGQFAAAAVHHLDV